MLLHAQNFEAYADGAWTAFKDVEGWGDSGGFFPFFISSLPGWHARRSLWVGTGYASIPVELDASTRVLCFQAAFKPDELDAGALISLGGASATISIAAGGALQLSSSGGTHVSAAGIVRAKQWHYLEIRAQMGASSRVHVLVDGRWVFDVSGVATSDGSDFSIRLSGASAEGTYWSEVVVMDGSGPRCNDLLGMRTRIAMLLPAFSPEDADVFVATIDGVAQPGVNQDLHRYLDDPLPGANDGSATGVQGSAIGGLVLLRFDPPQGASSYEAVTVILEGFADGGGDPLFAAALYSGAVEIEGEGVGTGIARVRAELDPNGDKPWTYTALRALEAGVLSIPNPV